MHKEIEEYLERSGLAWTHLRPTGFMQEYLREAPSIINDGAFYLALGDVRLNPIDLIDVAKAAFLLLRDGGHEGARIAITGPEAHPQTPPYKWWNWHDDYDAEVSPDPKWLEVSGAGEAAFRKRDAEAS